jgi:hypothetical protein
MTATTKQRTLIDTAYQALHVIPRSLKRMTDEIRESETQHRRGTRPVRNFSIVTATKYFVVKWLLDALRRTAPVRPSEALHIRPECFMALAIADEYRDALQGLLTAPWVAEFDKLDYVELMKD